MRTDPGEIDLGVIDQGSVHSGPAGPAGLDGRGWPTGLRAAPSATTSTPRPPPRARTRLQRWWPMAALTLVLVASTGASAPSARGLVPAFHAPAEQRTSIALTDHTLYVATGTPATALIEDPEWTLSAYRLSDGAQRWQVPHNPAARHSSISVQVVDGVPLVTGWRSHAAQTIRPPIHHSAQTTAYDPVTGEERWTHHGFPAGDTDGRVVLDLREYEGSPPDLITYLTATVDLATGRILWNHRLTLDDPPLREATGTGIWTLSEDGRYLATLRRDGQLSVLDLSTGTEAVEDLGRSWHDASLVTVDGLLRVSSIRDRKRTLAVYDLYPPAERWTTTDRFAPTTLTPCGPVFCLRDGDQLQGVDRVTGSVQWSSGPGWLSAGPLDAPWPDNQLQVVTQHETATDEATVETLVLDAATGQQTLTLGAWTAYPASYDHPYPVVSLREEGAYRPGHPDYDPGRLWLGRVEPAQPDVRVLGALDLVSSCDIGERYLACVSTEQRVEVWHIRVVPGG